MSFNHNSISLSVLPILGAMVLQGCGDGSNGSAAAVVVSNLPPIITSERAVGIDEGSDGLIYTATATDAEGDSVTFSIANLDAADFTIDSQTGEIAFFSEPDFEAPEDADFDNVYSFNLTATDSNGGVNVKYIVVQVVDIVDSGQRYLEKVLTEIDTQRDIEYAPGLFVDIFTPSNDSLTDRPVMIVASGGGFVNEDRTRVEDVATEFAERGYVAATMSYRVASGQLSADELTIAGIMGTHDMFAAVRFFRADALGDNVYGTNPDAIFASGESAGAVMSAIAATLDPDDIVTSAALSDYLADNGGAYGDVGDHDGVSSVVNGALALTGAILELSWVDAESAPLYAAHEEFDPVLPCGTDAEGAHFSGLVVSGACALVPEYEAANAPAELYLVEAVVDHVGFTDEQRAEIYDGAASLFFYNVIWSPADDE